MRSIRAWHLIGFGVGFAASQITLGLEISPVSPGIFELSWPSVDARAYGVSSTTDWLTWLPEGDPVVGTGGLTATQVTKNGRKRFYRVESSPVRPGFESVLMHANDDESYRGEGLMPVAVPLGFTVNFYGESISECYINNNGNITFDSALKSFTPMTFGVLERKIIAPFWADVDTLGENSGLVGFSGGQSVNGRAAFGVTYRNVGYFDAQSDKLNTFQVVMIDRSDIGPGDFDIEFNYGRLLWETGSASDGVDGYGGQSARAGIANGSGLYFEYRGSGESLSFLDFDPNTNEPNIDEGLIYQRFNSTMPGRIVLPIRGGELASGFTVDAGVDFTLAGTAGAKFQLQGMVDPGVEFSWQGVPDGGGAVFSDPNDLNPTVTIPSPGVWEFKLTGVRAGEFVVTSCDSVVVTHPGFFDVDAGPDLFISGDSPQTVTFSEAVASFTGGVAVDVEWQQTVGQQAVITDPTVLQAEVLLPGPGFYQFNLTATTAHSPEEERFTRSNSVSVSFD